MTTLSLIWPTHSDVTITDATTLSLGPFLQWNFTDQIEVNCTTGKEG